MSTLDLILIGFVALTALVGLRTGLVATVLSLAGLLVGAVAGARLAPQLLSGGSRSDYAGVAGLVGSIVGAVALRAAARVVGPLLRGGLRFVPPLRLLDMLGGGVAGATWGLALVWVAGAAAVQLPKDAPVRDDVRASEVLRTLNDIAPPRRVLDVEVRPGRVQLPLGL